jgi:hypothetical protein
MKPPFPLSIFCLHFKLKLKKIENGSFMEIYYKWYWPQKKLVERLDNFPEL